MKSYVSRIAATLSWGMFVLPALTLSAQPQTSTWWFYGCPTNLNPQGAGSIPNPGSKGWIQYQSSLQQYYNVAPQKAGQIAPILANEGRKIIAIRNNNALSKVQKIQGVNAIHQQSDQRLKAIFSSLQYQKLKVVRQEATRWVTEARRGWQ
jgi:hypothetical protein